MLQISSGKFFSRESEYKNDLQGKIYTNLRVVKHQKLKTAAGTLLTTEDMTELNILIYEFEEYIESLEPAPGVVASYGISSLILDFSSILSFALNCTASPSYALTERLIGDQPGVTTHFASKQIVSRVFDNNIDCQDEDIDFFIKFTSHLIGLDRDTYLGVIRSIRTYVTGMQRIADDFELAYTLLVASLESLAQSFDGHQSTWAVYDPKKRKNIDNALRDADDITADRVRKAVLANEHTSLGKRFKDFSINYIRPDFYREKADGIVNPISIFDMPVMLTNAYQARSKYIHTLEKLPKQLTRPTGYSETCSIENKPWLTLQGLARLTREVIINFTMEQTIIGKENYDYQLEIPNIMEFEFAPSCWIHHIDFSPGSGKKKLEGFLSQLANGMLKAPNSILTDLTNLLEALEEHMSSLKREDKRSFIALYIAYHYFLNIKTDKVKNFLNKYNNEILIPCIEGLIIFNLLGTDPSWQLQIHYDCTMSYFKKRNHKNNIRLPKLFETGILLQLAERYRKNGDDKSPIDIIRLAVENQPGCQSLIKLEKDYKSQPFKIDWGKY